MSSASGSLLEAVHAAYASRYSSLSAGIIVVFDHLLTLDREIDLVWKKSRSLGKFLFIVNRYYALSAVVVNNYFLLSPNLTDQVSLFSGYSLNAVEHACSSDSHGTIILNSSCIRFYYWQGYSGAITCMIAESILQMRLYALYSLDKRILYLMIVSFILSTVASITIVNFILANLQAATRLIPGFSFCFPVVIPPYFYALWIPMLAFETVLFALAAFQGFRTHRRSNSPSHYGEPLFRILIRDSVIYYVMLFATYLTCVLVTVINRKFFEVPIPFALALSCVFGNRTILNVREFHSEVHGDKMPLAGSRRPRLDHQVRKTPGPISSQTYILEDMRTTSTGDAF
ncbi:hypothetical protein GYMLUDRAFT_251491 [Collybiopsis luxurians FD-317 M1]|uniref:DUF6533 domain-containing protein n=1 Tax=Collybiopsis luxurians FD-317 M1 TaxID=944289 RepID=A0A0D0C2R5_9AGAR|nr:hypothetical protein GYMLUDRAFT_251491 [Collybiopsis luxurians FD-317 M1]